MLEQRRETVKERCRSKQEQRENHMNFLLVRRQLKKMEKKALEDRKRKMIVERVRYALLTAHIVLLQALYSSRYLW